MASPISALSGSSASNPAASTTGLGAAPPSEEMFLKLLVSQLQNQDPLNPTDSTQFVTQLAQFSELEQVMAVRQDTDGILSQIKQSANPPAASTTTQTQS